MARTFQHDLQRRYADIPEAFRRSVSHDMSRLCGDPILVSRCLLRKAGFLQYHSIVGDIRPLSGELLAERIVDLSRWNVVRMYADYCYHERTYRRVCR